MKIENLVLRLLMLAALGGSLLPVAAVAADEDKQAPAAKEEEVPVKPQAAPAPAAPPATAPAKAKAAAPAKTSKPAAPVAAKPKAPEPAHAAKKPVEPASDKGGSPQQPKEKSAETTIHPAGAQAPEAQKPANAAPVVAEKSVPVEAPAVPGPGPKHEAAPSAKPEASGGFFKRLFGFGDSKKTDTKAEVNVPVGRPPLPHVNPDAAKAAQSGAPSRPSFDPLIPSAPPPPPQNVAKDIDPKRLEAAKKVAKHFEVKDKVESAIRAPLRGVQFRLRNENMDKMDKIQSVLEEIIKAESAKHEEDGRENKAVFLAQNYTVDELKQLEAFFGSEAGQKTIKLWSLMNQRDVSFGMNVAAQQAVALRDAAIKKAKKEGLKIPQGMEPK